MRIFIEYDDQVGGDRILKKINVDKEIHRLIDIIRNDQSPDGSWKYPFETGVATDAYMIILLRTLEINDEQLIEELVKRIITKQWKNGAWTLLADEANGNITTTFEAYYALLCSGYINKTHPRMMSAKKFILANGGLKNIHPFAKILLAITGQYKWPSFFSIPVETILLPVSFPVNFFSFPVYARANLCPIMILADKKFSMKPAKSPDITDLFLTRPENDFWKVEDDEWRSLSSFLKQSMKSLIGLPEKIHKAAIKQAKRYMLDRIEPDGTFYNYFSSTFLMIFALLALGHSKDDPIIMNAVNGLKNMKTIINGKTHMQYTDASVWNTALISTACQEAGISPKDPMIKKANEYLLSHQHKKFGDWRVHNMMAMPGGWGFSDGNTINPDVDDTTAALRSLARCAREDAKARHAWEKGIKWVVSMQNGDGGWPAFERLVDHKWLHFLPLEKGEFFFSDPSTADLTGRTLEFFGRFTKMDKNHPVILRGVEWLLNHQKKNGSWYGRWGICYIYGTWAAVTGLVAAGVSPGHRAILKSVKWLETIQNPDGGWGESGKSDKEGRYIPLGASTLTHTAWAVDALIAAADRPTKSIQSGIAYLKTSLEKDDWTVDYPKGQGLAGSFYIHYHSYRLVFSLLALAHYREKFN
jgi:sporulenol synthase